MSRPKVNRLVLYKHGVAFVSRRGPVEGDFELTFRRDDMKDVLKSLTVDAADGDASVGAVCFDTPADPRTELADRNLLLDTGEALVGLIEALRGRAVAVHCGDQTHRGEVIGIDDAAEASQRRLLVLRADSGAVSLVDLADARRLELLEAPSQDDLDYLIDRSRAATAGRDCDVTVQIRGAADDTRVSYIVAAPMWRVSYRAIRDGDTVTLIATGIIHNPIDEDLTDVEVTLTTGQPISFDIDLYHSRQVQRVVVDESERRAAPREALTGAVPGSAGFSVDVMPMAGAYEAAAGEVETSDRGEYFEYRLGSPLSLKRGGAAMVPLAVAPVDGVRREVVWREDRGAAPDIMLAFTNTTGVVLEEGPAVVYEHDDYAGEAMLGFTARGAEVRLAFAKDLAVRCRRFASSRAVTTRIRLTADTVVEEQRCERRHTLHAENDHDDPVDVVFELPMSAHHAVTAQDGATEAGREGTWRRFSVTVPGHATAEATVLETWPVSSEIAYDDLEPGQLEEWLAGRSLDKKTVKALSQVLAHQSRALQLDEQAERVQEQRDEIHAAQSRIAEQLRVLGTEGAEGELRARQVRELDALQDRAGALEAEARRLRDEAEDARQRASAELRRVIGQTRA